MARRKVNLKKRLGELRNEPEPAITISITLDAATFKELSIQAEQHRLSLELYIQQVLQRHLTE